MGARGPKKGSPGHPMTAGRIAVFLAAYRESGGNFQKAAAAACPGGKEGARRPCYSTFVQLKKKDLGFAAACDEILLEIADMIEAEIRRRGEEGWLEPVIQKGTQATMADGSPAFIRRFDSKLLLARARALMPDKYGDRKDVTITHKRAGGMLVIEASDIKHFSQAQIDALGGIVATIRKYKDGGAPETPSLEYQPAPVMELPVTEIETETVAVEVTDAEKVFPY